MTYEILYATEWPCVHTQYTTEDELNTVDGNFTLRSLSIVTRKKCDLNHTDFHVFVTRSRE